MLPINKFKAKYDKQLKIINSFGILQCDSGIFKDDVYRLYFKDIEKHLNSNWVLAKVLNYSELMLVDRFFNEIHRIIDKTNLYDGLSCRPLMDLLDKKSLDELIDVFRKVDLDYKLRNIRQKKEKLTNFIGNDIMISIDEIKYTKERLNTIMQSSDSIEERAMSQFLADNLESFIGQMEMFIKSMQFKEYVENFKKLEEEKEKEK